MSPLADEIQYFLSFFTKTLVWRPPVRPWHFYFIFAPAPKAPALIIQQPDSQTDKCPFVRCVRKKREIPRMVLASVTFVPQYVLSRPVIFRFPLKT